jgi:hypothetical protein
MNKQIIGHTGDDRVEEIYSDACESIHAPQELYGKVMDMTEEKIRMIRIKRLAIAAAFLVTLIIGSNVITYAITDKGWIERLKVTMDSSDVNIVDILEEEDSNGRTHYLITYQAEANGKSISIGTCDPGILEGKTFRVEGDKIFVTDADGNEHIVNAIDSEAEGYTAVLVIPIPYPED